MTRDTSSPMAYLGTELHLHISGSISASLMPWWIHWLRYVSPEVIVNVSVSLSACRFITLDAVSQLANGEVWIDDWSQAELPRSWRHGRPGNSECILLIPASLDTTMRLSQGRADSPALMMLQNTTLPIIIGDVIPVHNPVIDYWKSILTKRSNIFFAPRIEGLRADNRDRQSIGFDFPGSIEIANQQIQRLS